MNKRVTLLLVSLTACLLIGGALLVKDSAAQADPGWLSFDPASGSGSPQMAVLSASSQSIALQADLPGAAALLEQTIASAPQEPQPVQALLNEGFTMVACGIDTIFLRDGARGVVRGLKQAAGGGA